jgi:Domain of unknown function (DUF4349)
MERSSDHNDLATALAEARPAPRDAFAQELDERVATGFPRRSRLDASPLASLGSWLRGLSPQRLGLAAAATALAAIAIATVMVAGNSSHTRSMALDNTRHKHDHGVEFSKPIPGAAVPQSSKPTRRATAPQASSATGGGDSSSPQYRTLGPAVEQHSFEREAPTSAALGEPTTRHREIERSAEIGLLADPADVADDSAKVFAAVHDANGIVLHSTTSSGKNGSARFELLIPSARLGDALAAFSSIDAVRSRHEATDDITKPTVTVGEELQDSQARVDSLLAQLSSAEAESEREAIAAELRAERGHAARLHNQLARLHQRTTYSRVLVRIQSGASSDSGGAWGIGDAFHDAGHILGIAAGVTLVGLAVIAPLALLCLLAWLAQRLWLRTRRERALDA